MTARPKLPGWLGVLGAGFWAVAPNPHPPTLNPRVRFRVSSKWWKLAAAVVGACVLAWSVQGTLAPAEEPPRAEPAATPQRPATAQADGAAAPSERVQATALLNQSRWAVELHRMYTKQVELSLDDTLTFVDGTLSSEWFGPLGYAPGMFTLSIAPAGTPVWESTQLSQQDGIVLWRGELDRDTIRGTVSRLPLAGASEDFRFEGKEMLAATASVPSAPASPAAPAEAPGAPSQPQPAGPADVSGEPLAGPSTR